MRRLRYARWPPLRSARNEDRLRANQRKRPGCPSGTESELAGGTRTGRHVKLVGRGENGRDE